MTHILLCTLGASWAVVPEIYGFVNVDKLPLYRHHADFKTFLSRCREYQLHSIDEIWICTTQGEATEKSLTHLRKWVALLTDPPVLRIWQAQGTNELASQSECAHIQELILRCCLKAHEQAQGGQVLMSLAGGRKTMSADMQWAASLFGCQAMLHVIGAEYRNMPEALQKSAPELFTTALKTEVSAAIMPLITGQTQRSDLLDIRMENTGAVNARLFPLALPDQGQTLLWQQSSKSLATELKKREKISSRLLGNYFLDLSREEKHGNWRSLYRLSPRLIEKLRATPITEQHKAWLERLPKADLHRHLGGCLSLPEQQKVAQALWAELSTQRKSKALEAVQHLLKDTQSWHWNWATELKKQPNRSDLAAALLIEASEQQLVHNLWQVTEPRCALKDPERGHRYGFSAYERPGDLTGSTLLSAAEAVAAYAQCVVEQSVREGLAYVELRGSPQKYGNGLSFLRSFKTYLDQALASLPAEKQPLFRFIIIADRRKSIADLAETIHLAVQAKQTLPDFIIGLDMAGDESYAISEQVSQCFLPAFELCMPLTIHAGEGERAASIWRAAYHLHADRIGHGLTIADHPGLAERFRNRDICLELCPSSNLEVVGFYDPDKPASHDMKKYPLMQLWEQGLPLTICTDNPGISRTTLTHEYITASRLSDDKLMQWDALAMIRQGFVHGFLAEQEKEALLKKCDATIYQMLMDNKE